MLPRFEADAALALMAKEDVTFFAGVPTMYWGLLGALDDSGVDVDDDRRRTCGSPRPAARRSRSRCTRSSRSASA